MAYILNSTTIANPHSVDERNNTQAAQNRTLDGSVVRDYFGDNKRTWILSYRNKLPSDYTTIKNIYDTHLSTGNAVTWEVTESNYTISETNVHVDLQVRSFTTQGEDYISDFDLILTEA